MDLTGISSVLDIGGKLIDRIWPDESKRDAAKLELFKAQQAGAFKELEAQLAQMQGQVDINKAEAQSGNAFQAGWRPFIGWVCGFGLAYQYLVRPGLSWIAMNALGWTELPSLDISQLMALLVPMLGLGVYRTIEKVKGVA